MLAELLCRQGQCLTMELERHGVACTLAAQLAVGPGTVLKLDVAIESLDQADGVPSVEPPVLHLARQQDADSWAPILTAQVQCPHCTSVVTVLMVHAHVPMTVIACWLLPPWQALATALVQLQTASFACCEGNVT